MPSRKSFLVLFFKKGLLPFFLFPSLALAHAQLEETVPPVGSKVPAAPSDLSLAFSEGVEPRFSKVVVTDGRGVSVNAGPVRVDPADGHRLLVPVGRLAAGVYTVIWHAVSVDTHRTQGAYHFTVAP